MLDKKYSVAVLLSFYNGKKYICEQIESILNQENVNITLYIRDDGSSDVESVKLLEKYISTNNVIVFNEKNVGVGESFIRLLSLCDNKHDYYCFADQDDIWLPQKIISAIRKISFEIGPCLYTSNQIVVDSNLNNSYLRYENILDTSFLQILCQNKFAGCTMVWNKSLHLIIANKDNLPSKQLLKNRIHDVWVAMVASCLGKIVYDDSGYILYRQHSNNVVGVKQNNQLILKLKKIFNKSDRNGRSLLAKEVVNNFYDIIKEEKVKEKLLVYAYYSKSFKYKKKLLKDKEIIKYSNERPFEFKLKVLFNLF